MLQPDRFWTRRDFLKLVSRAGLISAVPSVACAAATLNSDTVSIAILHTTDLHGHILPTTDYNGNPDLGGLARCVTQIRHWRQQNPNSILIDVGDVYQGTDVGLRTKGELMIDLFNHLKYDAWIVGNHEFDWGIEPFLHAVEKSTMPVLAANTLMEGRRAGEISDAKNPFAKIQPYIMKEIRGNQDRDHRSDDAGHAVLVSTGIYPRDRFSISGRTGSSRNRESKKRRRQCYRARRSHGIKTAYAAAMILRTT